jgi:hypothetical protein
MDDVDLIYFNQKKNQNSIIMPCDKSQLGHIDQFKTI